ERERRSRGVGYMLAAVGEKRAYGGVHTIAGRIGLHVLPLQLQLVGLPDVVAVVERDPLLARRIDAGVAGCRRASGEGQVDDAYARKEFVQIAPLLGRGTVVDDDNFRRRKRLAEYGIHTLVDE